MREIDLAPDHGLHQGILVEFGDAAAADQGAVAQHRHPVANLEDFIQVVRDVKQGDALGLQAGDDAEKQVDLRAGKDCRGLIQDQHLAVQRERLGNRHHLLVSHFQAADRCIHVELGLAHVVQDLLRPLAGSRPVDAPTPPGELVAQRDILGHAQRGDQVDLLVDGIDAVLTRPARVDVLELLPLVDHLAAVGLIRPGDDLDQRRLAGAVLPNQAVHLAGVELQVHIFQHLHAGEGFTGIAQSQDGGRLIQWEAPVDARPKTDDRRSRERSSRDKLADRGRRTADGRAIMF